jgi:hypothetical protein
MGISGTPGGFPASHQLEGFFYGVGSHGAGLVQREGAQGRVEGFGLDGAVVADLEQGVEKLFDGNDSGGGGQLAAVVMVLIEREAGRSVVQVDGDDILRAQGQKILLSFLRVEPMPAVELDAQVVGADGGEQLFHFAERMNEGIFLASPQRTRGDIFQAEFLAVIGENLSAQAQALGMLTKIL